MPLKVELKPFERIIIGQSVVTNSDTRAKFLIDGKAPILREKDILTAETANTPVKRLYLCIQMMYLEDDIPKYQDLYMGFVKDLLEAVQWWEELSELSPNPAHKAGLSRALSLLACSAALADHRLVTLCGPGGAGKTRLAREVTIHASVDGAQS